MFCCEGTHAQTSNSGFYPPGEGGEAPNLRGMGKAVQRGRRFNWFFRSGQHSWIPRIILSILNAHMGGGGSPIEGKSWVPMGVLLSGGTSMPLYHSQHLKCLSPCF